MKKIFLYAIMSVACFLSLPEIIQAQSKRNANSLWRKSAQIEINQYFNFDKYPEFISVHNPTYNFVTNIKGNSWGIDVGYKFNVAKKILLKPFIGYYKFSFNKIDTYNELFNVHATGRQIISPPSPTFWMYSTDKYFYHCVNAGVSVEYEIFKKKFISISGGLLINNYITLSQRYHYYGNNPDSFENPHKESRVDFLGFRADAFTKFLIPVKRFNVGPTVSLPIYTLWKTDAEFPEETNSGTRSKRFSGWGIGISVNYNINNFKKNNK